MTCFIEIPYINGSSGRSEGGGNGGKGGARGAAGGGGGNLRGRRKEMVWEGPIPSLNSYPLHEINISHLGKRKIIFKYALSGGYVNSLESNSSPPENRGPSPLKVEYSLPLPPIFSSVSFRDAIPMLLFLQDWVTALGEDNFQLHDDQVEGLFL